MPTRRRQRKVGRPDNEQIHQLPEFRFVHALLEQWINDALAGDPIAIRDMRQPHFDSWCVWLDINPDTIRARVRAHLINRQPITQQGAYPTS